MIQPDRQEKTAKNVEPLFEVYVKTLTGKTILAWVRDYESVFDLKNKISKQDGIPVDQQRLIFAGKQMEDPNTLASYKILPHSTIHLVLRLRGDGRTHITVFIKTLTGKTIEVPYLSRDEKVRGLKAIIQDREGIAPDIQNLIYAGKQMDNDASLQSYGIQHEAALHLVLSLPSNENTTSSSPGGTGYMPSASASVYKLYIKTLIGTTIPIEVVHNASIWNLKTKVFDAEGIPQDQQRMIHTGKQLEDERTIQDYGIKNYDTIHLVLRLKGPN